VRIGTLAAAALAVAMFGAAAHAGPGYTTADVNFRTGPDTEFPSVGVIPEGDEIFVHGCLRDESWCDVEWGRDRGWVYSEYIAFDYHGEMTPLPDVGIAAFGIPIIGFVASDYWGHYYVGRPWYRDRDRWFAFRVHPRRGWHAPPAGPRRAGWWRSGYHAPMGMIVPPGRGWHRPMRHEHREDRRDDRRDYRRDHGHGDHHDDHDHH
jgi:uncharacterized protein YraI